MKDNKTILEVYKKRRYNELLIAKREKLDNLKDGFSGLVQEYNDKLLELFKKENREDLFENFKLLVTYTPKSKQEKIDEIEKEFKDAMDDRNRLVEEVTAQLDLCTTREEHLEVFKLYGIIDENGKIYDYKK